MEEKSLTPFEYEEYLKKKVVKHMEEIKVLKDRIDVLETKRKMFQNFEKITLSSNNNENNLKD